MQTTPQVLIERWKDKHFQVICMFLVLIGQFRICGRGDNILTFVIFLQYLLLVILKGRIQTAVVIWSSGSVLSAGEKKNTIYPALYFQVRLKTNLGISLQENLSHRRGFVLKEKVEREIKQESNVSMLCQSYLFPTFFLVPLAAIQKNPADYTHSSSQRHLAQK